MRTLPLKQLNRSSQKNEQVISALANTGDRLSSAIDTTASFIHQRKGTGGAADAAFNLVEHTSSLVKEELQLAANIAAAAARNAAGEVDVLTALDERATGAITTIRAAESTIRELSSGNEDLNKLSQLTFALTRDSEDILRDVDAADTIAVAISKDVAANEEALGVLARSSSDIQSLISSVDAALNAAADVIGVKDDATAEKVTKAVSGIEEMARGVELTLEEVKNTREKCEEFHVKELIANTEKIGQEMKNKPRVDDTMLELMPKDPESIFDEDDAKHFENHALGDETGRELPDVTTAIANGHHVDCESVSDVTLSAVDRIPDTATNSISSDHLAEALLTNGDPGSFKIFLTTLESVASGSGLSILPSSDTAHNVITSTKETLTEVMTAVSSIQL